MDVESKDTIIAAEDHLATVADGRIDHLKDDLTALLTQGTQSVTAVGSQVLQAIDTLKTIAGNLPTDVRLQLHEVLDRLNGTKITVTVEIPPRKEPNV